jgi:choice-of-anchor C domain-containing protein
MALAMGGGAIVNMLKCQWNTVLIMRHDGYPDSRLFVYLHIQNDTAPVKIGRVYTGQFLGYLRDPDLSSVCGGAPCEIDYVPGGGVCSRSFGRHLHLGFGAGRGISIDGNIVADLTPGGKYDSTNLLSTNSANIVANGDFETPVVLNPLIVYFEGQTFGSWTVVSGSVDLLSPSYWQAADGGQSVDLSGDSDGAISQPLSTTPQRKYVLRFALAGNPETTGCPNSPIKTMEVWWGATLVDTLTFDTTGRSNWDMGWGFHEYTVTAANATTQLKFGSLTPGCHGPVLDMVSVRSRTGPSRTFQSIATNDGWVLESAGTSGEGGALNNAGHLVVGDNAADRQYRSILSFNTSALPDTAVITRVTLQVRKTGLVGTDPFTTHGKFLVDVRTGPFAGSGALQLQDFQAQASKAAAMSIMNKPVNGWYSGAMGAANSAYINKAGLTQFRLRFAEDDNEDRGADYLSFYSGNAWAALRPLLIIEYYVP